MHLRAVGVEGLALFFLVVEPVGGGGRVDRGEEGREHFEDVLEAVGRAGDGAQGQFAALVVGGVEVVDAVTLLVHGDIFFFCYKGGWE